MDKERNQRLRELEGLGWAMDGLRKLSKRGYEENDRLRKHGYVFNRPFDQGVPTEEAAKWEYLAFWLHTELWEAAQLAEGILEVLESSAQPAGEREGQTAKEIFKLASRIEKRDKWFIGGFLGVLMEEWREQHPEPSAEALKEPSK